MSCFLICGLAGAGGVGKRGVFHVLAVGGCVWWYFSLCQILTVSLQLVSGCLCCCLWPYDGLGSGVGYILKHLGCVAGGVMTASSVLLWGTDCGHWGVLVIHKRIFIIWIGSAAGDWFCIWLRLFSIWIIGGCVRLWVYLNWSNV